MAPSGVWSFKHMVEVFLISLFPYWSPPPHMQENALVSIWYGGAGPHADGTGHSPTSFFPQ